MTDIKLSILTPSVWDRIEQCRDLKDEIEKQIEENSCSKSIEHLVLIDNKVMSIGRKRQALLDQAKGKYVAFVDDDDKIIDGYIKEFIEAFPLDVDVITFNQKTIIDGKSSIIEFKMDNPEQQWMPNTTVKRGVWHVCFCKRELVSGDMFSDNNYGEDFYWIKEARKKLKTEYHVDKILHEYIFDRKKTLAV